MAFPQLSESAKGGDSTRISVIVPVHNDHGNLIECLSAFKAKPDPNCEIIVVDDASTDNTPIVAAGMEAQVLRLPVNAGPAAARNYGARHAQGDILFFVDADVVVAPGAVRHVVQIFKAHPDVAAVFGSYNAAPRARGLLSQYWNLRHHFVHQNGNQEASTFWAGCGAIRRTVFQTVGGFDEERFRQPSVEDIELGYRLRGAGHRILLDKALQATHLKQWNLWSVIRTDIFHRAIPWSRLIVETKTLPNDLNLKLGQRVSCVLATLACSLFASGMFHPELLAGSVVALLGIAFLNRSLYTFFFRQHGVVFAVACIPLHLLYYLYSGLSYFYVWCDSQTRRAAKVGHSATSKWLNFSRSKS